MDQKDESLSCKEDSLKSSDSLASQGSCLEKENTKLKEILNNLIKINQEKEEEAGKLKSENQDLKNKLMMLKKKTVTKSERTESAFVKDLRIIKVISEHSSYVASLCLLKDGRFASASKDKTIKIFDLESYECEMTIIGHLETVSTLCLLDNGILVSGSADKTIKFWSIGKSLYTCQHTISKHSQYILKVVKLSRERLGSISVDRTAMVHQSHPPYSTLKVFESVSDFFTSIIELKNKSFLVFGDARISFYDNSTYYCACIIEDVYCDLWENLIEVNSKIVCGGHQAIYIINWRTFQNEAIFILHKAVSINTLAELSNSELLCGDEFGNIFQFNVNECKFISIKEMAHSKAIYKIINLNRQIFTCSADNLIKIWKF